MALRPLVSKHNVYPTFTCYQEPSFRSKETLRKVLQSNISRRTMASTVLLAREAIFSGGIANAFDFRMVAPDQTVQQAESGIRDHVRSLLQVKALLESQSWSEAQKTLRTSSSYLKQDIYTLIQIKPASERPQLRELYSDLFNNVTKLDYATRDKDVSRVWQFYENIVVALDGILSTI
ncbi:hypothetical protein LWI29_019887 [Acer saccharum]|uniref:PsbQ-like protein 3, chloroplastic n=1 Tax=Acer saccharum TaxID=4024 RepID=A0AA39SMG0_ACESA|nr:hypothetical protein LWI29_019887 [Acer saccharum]